MVLQIFQEKKKKHTHTNLWAWPRAPAGWFALHKKAVAPMAPWRRYLKPFSTVFYLAPSLSSLPISICGIKSLLTLPLASHMSLCSLPAQSGKSWKDTPVPEPTVGSASARSPFAEVHIEIPLNFYWRRNKSMCRTCRNPNRNVKWMLGKCTNTFIGCISKFIQKGQTNAVFLREKARKPGLTFSWKRREEIVRSFSRKEN